MSGMNSKSGLVIPILKSVLFLIANYLPNKRLSENHINSMTYNSPTIAGCFWDSASGLNQRFRDCIQIFESYMPDESKSLVFVIKYN